MSFPFFFGSIRPKMESFFTTQYQFLWTAGLGLALFFPVRQLIWVLSVRRVERKEGPTDEEGRRALKRRAGFTAALLCFVFSVVYVNSMFSGQP